MEDDDGTAALVLRLQLEDLASILTPADGEGNSDNEAAIDQAYALQLYQQELSAQRTILNDRRIASDIQAGRRPRIATTETGLARPADHSLSQEVRQRVNPWRAVVRAALPAPHLRPVQPAAGPATEPGTETAIDLAPEPTAEPAAEPIPESIPEPTPEPVAKPAAEPNPELNPESATALAVESVAGTTSESVPEPISEPTPEPATDLADDPVVEPASEAPAELATEPPPQLTSGDDEVDTLLTGSIPRPVSCSSELSNTTFFTAEEATPTTTGEPSSAAGHDARPIRLHCVACLSDFPHFDIATLPGCRHHYCRACLDELFRLSLTDETLFPPRCCRQPIPFADVRDLLTAATARDFERRRPELETADRTYCHVPTCSMWIPPAEITDGDRVGTCPGCAARTCATCKGEAHDWGEQECLGDEATQTLLRAADENRWQRCYNCKRFVELNTGCYHITCRCRAQFCYLCGARWKTCTCRQMDVRRLFKRARVVAQRGGQNATRRDVERVAQRLRRNHECTHEEFFDRIAGRHQCENCHDTLHEYILECPRCMLHVCLRCRRNRL